MFKPRTIVVVVAMALACSAVVASAAAAATEGWMVGGTTLGATGTAALALSTIVDEPFVLTGAANTFTCTKLDIEEGKLFGVNKDSETLIFLGCGPDGACTVKNETIKTVPLLSESTLEGTLAVSTLFKPETGTLFTDIELAGEQCAEEALPVKGTARVLSPTGQDERTLQLLSAKTVKGELILGSEEASLKGSALVGLANNKPWSLL